MKKYLSIALIVSMVIILGATTQQEQHKGFKNLKVLPKDITEDNLDSVMANWSVSLGARCNFCHAASADTTKKGHLDFASDAKDEKKIAREMFTMTAEINEKFFNYNHSAMKDTLKTLICYSCHRGEHRPMPKFSFR